MSYSSRRNSSFRIFKTFKDYLVPFLIVFVLLVFLINNLFFDSDRENSETKSHFLEVSPGDLGTDAFVVHSSGNKTKIEGKMVVYKTEKLLVKNGSLNLKSKNANLVLNRLGELRYNEDESYTLYSSDLWVKSNTGINVELRYGKAESTPNSVFSLSQNEVASTIYVLSGVVSVQNLAGKTATLKQGEKLVIMRNSANDASSDLSLKKEEIDDYIKSDDWFIKNNGDYYLSLTGTTRSDSSNQSLIASTGSSPKTDLESYISFSNLHDEGEIDSSLMDINGVILSDLVHKIDLNGTIAKINNAAKTFSVNGFKFKSGVNDLVYKVYDEGDKLLSKGVITVYLRNGDTSSNPKSSALAQVQNYPITSSPIYQIISPKQNPYITTEDFVKIEGRVPPGVVERIVINDFQLRKFPRFGSYWSYFANSNFDNLKDGVNIYKIQYFAAGGKLVHENVFTIIKEPKKLETSTGAILDPISGTSSSLPSGEETSTGTIQ